MGRIVKAALIKSWIEHLGIIFENVTDVDCPHMKDSEAERAKLNKSILSLKKEMEYVYHELNR